MVVKKLILKVAVAGKGCLLHHKMSPSRPEITVNEPLDLVSVSVIDARNETTKDSDYVFPRDAQVLVALPQKWPSLSSPIANWRVHSRISNPGTAMETSHETFAPPGVTTKITRTEE